MTYTFTYQYKAQVGSNDRITKRLSNKTRSGKNHSRERYRCPKM